MIQIDIEQQFGVKRSDLYTYIERETNSVFYKNPLRYWTYLSHSTFTNENKQRIVLKK